MSAFKIKLISLCFLFFLLGQTVYAQEEIDTAYFYLDRESNYYFPKQKVKVSEILTNELGIFSANKFYSFRKGMEYELLGKKFTRFDQYIGSIKIVGNSYFITSLNDSIESIGGRTLCKRLELSSMPMDAETAIAKLMSHLNCFKYKWQDPEAERNIKQLKNDESATYFPKTELNIFKSYGNDFGSLESYHLGYKFEISGLKNSDDHVYFDSVYYMSATDAHIIGRSGPQCLTSAPQKAENTATQADHEIEQAPTPLTLQLPGCSDPCKTGAVTVHYYGGQNIHTSEFYYSGVCTHRLKNNCYGATLYTMEENGLFQLTDIMSSNNSWPNQTDKVGITGHWCLERTYEAFANILNRNSYDNAWGQLNLKIDNQLSSAWVNQGIRICKFNGSGSWQVTLDIIGHEFGHGVLETTTNIGASQNLSSQSALDASAIEGAIKEGVCDIFGQMVEYYVSGNYSTTSPNLNDFIQGGDRPGGPQSGHERSLVNPSSLGNPSVLFGSDYNSSPLTLTSTPYDWSVIVHHNSTIIGHWYYLLSMGGSGNTGAPWNNDYCVFGIGQDKASKIIYLASTFYINNFTVDYNGMMQATMQAAAALYGAQSYESAQVASAWLGVGVGSGYAGVIDVKNHTAAGMESYAYNSIVEVQNFTALNTSNVTITSNKEVRMLPNTDVHFAGIYSAYIVPACAGGARLSNPTQNELAGEELLNTIDEAILSQEINSDLDVIPNPSEGIFRLVSKNTAQFPLIIIVTDLLGTVVKEIKSPDPKDITIDLTGFDKGMYIVKVVYQHKTATKSIVKN